MTVRGRRCPVCDSSAHDDVFSLPRVPALINAQVRPEQAPHVARGDIDLVVCLGCGHLYNRSFDATLLDYDAAYENSLHFSDRFQRCARALARRLVVTHGLVGERVAEVGSGPGHFLTMLCQAGVAEALGFDPSHDPDRLGAPHHPGVTVSTEAFPTDGSVQVRLALSQHVLEHLTEPIGMLAAQRAAVASTGGAVYTEVPNGELMIEHGALWDLVYEHVSYFVPTSLERACRRAGLAVTVTGTAFSRQFLWCEAVPRSASDEPPDASRVAAAVRAARAFGATAAARVEQAQRDLASLTARGPVVVWGAGSKGMTYLNVASRAEPVAGVIDVNPRKQGWGVPGTSLVISDPELLLTARPHTVLVANPAYVDEIRRVVVECGHTADVVPIWG